jgi:hypothetical protein
MEAEFKGCAPNDYKLNVPLDVRRMGKKCLDVYRVNSRPFFPMLPRLGVPSHRSVTASRHTAPTVLFKRTVATVFPLFS